MLCSPLARTLARSTFSRVAPLSVRSISTTLPKMTLPKPNTQPPAKQMLYLPGIANSLPSETADFRTVLFTGQYSQVVLMTIPPGGDIGEETHTVDQFLSFTSGTGLATVGGKKQEIKAGDAVVVPAGTLHQFENTGPTPLILYTVYSPAEHNPSTVHKDKEEADKHEDDGTDEAPDWSQRSKAENAKLEEKK